ncbi:MAG: hypothetical protein V3U78_04465 [Thiotrichaceae bacterium]
MKVFLVTKLPSHRSAAILGIFDSKEKADNCIKAAGGIYDEIKTFYTSTIHTTDEHLTRYIVEEFVINSEYKEYELD